MILNYIIILISIVMESVELSDIYLKLWRIMRKPEILQP